MKKYYIGIDVGSVSVDGAVVSPDKKVIKDYYIRHKGHTLQTVVTLISQMLQEINFEDIYSLSVTGSGGKVVSELLEINFVNEVVAFSEANSYLYPEVKTVIEIGGEDSRFISMRFDEELKRSCIHDFSMNSLCAAGTGSFLDQQASRLGLKIEDFGSIALKSACPATIAGRCSTFAKSDMIHLQQIATPTEDIAAGLCYAMVRNFLSTIAKGKELQKAISFQGGVAANIAVVRAFENRIGFTEGELFVPKNHGTLGAIGAAFVSVDKADKKISFQDLKEIESKLIINQKTATTLKKLSYEENLEHHKDSEDSEYSFDEGGQILDAYLGIDIGSISTNLAVIDEQGNLIEKRYLMTSGRPIEAVRQGLSSIGSKIGDKIRIKGVCTTGSGRYMIGKIVGADVVKNEITAQARAAIEFNHDVDTIFEIGGQDSKYISIKDGVVVDFEMNKACAAGTGSFLEEQAERLNINIKKEFSELALQAKHPVELGERCTVFMNTNVGHFQAQGTRREDIVAGLCYSIVFNYLNRVVRGKKVGDTVFFQGGVAFNKGVIAAFEKTVGKKVIIPPNHEVSGAIGCALIARDNAKKDSAFKGFHIADKEYSNRLFICTDCVNRCEVNEIIMKNEPSLYFGSRCGKFDVQEDWVFKEKHGLFQEREKLLLEYTPESETEAKKKISIGIPRAMVAFYEFFPFWNAFFSELGCEVVLSMATNRNIIRRGLETSVSDYCFPIKVTHGHILNLIDKKVDYIFLPHIIDLEKDSFSKNTFMCPYVQSLPDIMEASLGLGNSNAKIIQPSLHYRRGRKHIDKVLDSVADKLGLRGQIVMNAIEKAHAHLQSFQNKVKKRGEEVIRSLGEGEKAVVIIGRLYNTCDESLNLGITEKLQERNIKAIPIDYLSLDQIDISKEFSDMYWHHGIRILKAAKYIFQTKNLYAIYLTNFGCGPDSFILSYFYRIMKGKPFLEIELDEHSADAGVLTRCEAFLDSLENIKND